MGWRRERRPSRTARGEVSRRSAMTAHEIRIALEARGVAAAFSTALSMRLQPRMADLAPAAADAMLDGVALALELQRETSHDLARSLRGLKEVERMMGAFSGELSKLDEVLEVLAAYVRRMKTQGGSVEPGRTLH